MAATSTPLDKSLPCLSAKGIGVVLLLTIAYGIVPLVGSSYLYEAILTPFLALSLAALGLNLLTGYAGQLSLGSSAFMAVGAYAAFNLSLRLPFLPLPATIVLAGLVAALAGLVAGLPPCGCAASTSPSRRWRCSSSWPGC